MQGRLKIQQRGGRRPAGRVPPRTCGRRSADLRPSCGTGARAVVAPGGRPHSGGTAPCKCQLVSLGCYGFQTLPNIRAQGVIRRLHIRGDR